MHKLSGFGMMGAAGVHLAMHWEWVTAAVGRLLGGRLPSAPSRAGNGTWWVGPTVILSIIILVTSAASYAVGFTPLANRIRPRGTPMRAESAGAAAGAGAGERVNRAGPDSAARAARREAMMRRRASEGGPKARGAAGGAPPTRPSLALRTYRTAKDIGLFMGLPFILTVGVLWLLRRTRRNGAPPVDPLDESGA
jgi:hypothetical protein